MMSWTHMVVSGIATSLILETGNPVLITIGASAGLLPDIDISVSVAGRVFPWISNWLERRFPHRSCTHSLFASTVVATFVYGVVLLLQGKFLPVAHALVIGYTFGWLLDMFSKSGVEMFWPSPDRYVCPGNRKFRLTTGSSAEYVLLGLLVAIALFVFNINASGGLLTQVNRFIGAPSGVEDIYKHSGSTHLIITHIEGVRSADKSPISGDFRIIQDHGQGFIVQSVKDERIYKVATDNNAQITLSKITADIGAPAITNVQTLVLDDEDLGLKLQPLINSGAMVFMTGKITVDDPQGIQLTPDPFEFPFIKLEDKSVEFEAAPLARVFNLIRDQYSTGQLVIRSITSYENNHNTSSL